MNNKLKEEEPVGLVQILYVAFGSALTLAIAFGVELSQEQVGAILAVFTSWSAVFGWWARKRTNTLQADLFEAEDDFQIVAEELQKVDSKNKVLKELIN